MKYMRIIRPFANGFASSMVIPLVLITILGGRNVGAQCSTAPVKCMIVATNANKCGWRAGEAPFLGPITNVYYLECVYTFGVWATGYATGSRGAEYNEHYKFVSGQLKPASDGQFKTGHLK